MRSIDLSYQVTWDQAWELRRSERRAAMASARGLLPADTPSPRRWYLGIKASTRRDQDGDRPFLIVWTGGNECTGLLRRRLVLLVLLHLLVVALPTSFPARVALRGVAFVREGRDAPELLAALAPLEVDVRRPVAPGRLRAGVADVLALLRDDAALRLAARPTSIFGFRFPPTHDAALPLAPSYFFEVQQCSELKVVLVVLLAFDVCR